MTDTNATDTSAAATKMTDKEFALLTAILVNDYTDGVNAEAPVWTWSACDSFGTSAGGIMASLSKKGWAGVNEDGEDSEVWATPAGFAAWKQQKEARA